MNSEPYHGQDQPGVMLVAQVTANRSEAPGAVPVERPRRRNRDTAVDSIPCFLAAVLGGVLIFSGCQIYTRESAEKARNRAAEEVRNRVRQISSGELMEPSVTDSIIHLAWKGDERELRAHLAAGKDINQSDQWGLTALHYAAGNGYVATAEVLFEYGADVNRLTNVGEKTPLHLAARNNRIEMVELLVARGSSVNQSAGPRTPQIAILTFERFHSIDRSTGYSGTPLHEAAEKGHTGVAGLLLDAGANVNAWTKSFPDVTPLHFAAENGHAETVELLLSRGAGINVITYHPFVADSLLERATGEIRMHTKPQRTAHGLAKMNNHAEVIRILEARGGQE